MLSEAARVMMASINPNKTPAKFFLRGDKRPSCQVLPLRFRRLPLEGEETREDASGEESHRVRSCCYLVRTYSGQQSVAAGSVQVARKGVTGPLGSLSR